MQESSSAPVDNRLGRRWWRRRRLLAEIFFSGIILTAILVTSFSIVRKNSTIRLTPERAQSLVLGLTRQSDAITYVEYVKARFLEECPGLNPAEFRYTVFSAGDDRNPLWRVSMLYEADRPAKCRITGALSATIGAIRPNEGKVIPARGGVDEDERPDWLTDFLAGKAPPA